MIVSPYSVSLCTHMPLASVVTICKYFFGSWFGLTDFLKEMNLFILV